MAFLIEAIVTSTPYKSALKLLRLHTKPFTCVTCMGFWVPILCGLILPEPEFLLAAGFISFFSTEINKIKNRY